MKAFFEKSRYLGLLIVFGLLVGTPCAMGWSLMSVFELIQKLILSFGKDPKLAIYFIELADRFLIAIALYVLTVSSYELFIGKLDLPDWMLAHDLNGLKEKLSSIVVLVVIVKFVSELVEWENPAATLQYALAVTLVCGILLTLGYLSKKSQ
jgi:uncharacterized membrane protein YqhA